MGSSPDPTHEVAVDHRCTWTVWSGRIDTPGVRLVRCGHSVEVEIYWWTTPDAEPKSMVAVTSSSQLNALLDAARKLVANENLLLFDLVPTDGSWQGNTEAFSCYLNTHAGVGHGR